MATYVQAIFHDCSQDASWSTKLENFSCSISDMGLIQEPGRHSWNNTCLRAVIPKNGFWFSTGTREFPVLKTFRSLHVSNHLYSMRYTGSAPGDKAVVTWYWTRTHTYAKGKNGWSCTSTLPCAFITWTGTTITLSGSFLFLLYHLRASCFLVKPFSVLMSEARSTSTFLMEKPWKAEHMNRD